MYNHVLVWLEWNRWSYSQVARSYYLCSFPIQMCLFKLISRVGIHPNQPLFTWILIPSTRLWLIISWNKSYGTIIPGCHPCYHLCIAASIVYIIAFAQLGYPSAFKLCYSPASSFLCITGLIMGCWTVDRSVYWVVCGWVNVSLYDISVKFSFCRSIQNFSFNIIYEPEWHTGSQLGLGIGPTKFWLSESFFYLLIVSRKFVFFILQN